MANRVPLPKSDDSSSAQKISAKYKKVVQLPDVSAPASKRVLDSREKRIHILTSSYVMAGVYVPITLKYYVDVQLSSYSNMKKKFSIKKIMRTIKEGTDVIITGAPGSGKSTSLRWIYKNINAKEFDNVIYLNARMFSACKTINDVFSSISNYVSDKKRCIIFFDGLDEVKCVSGKRTEWENIIKHLRKIATNNGVDIRKKCIFVISTRQEHFDFNNSSISFNDFVVFVTNSLSAKETMKVCKTIKKFRDFEDSGKKTSSKCFNDKFPPQNSDNKMTEREYISLLRKHLKNKDNTVLNNPMLCRYAYSYIQHLKASNSPANETLTLSKRIEAIIQSYTKREYYDRNEERSTVGKGKKKFEKLKIDVFELLTKIVKELDSDGFITRDNWSIIKGNLDINHSLCLLIEEEDGKLSFVHKMFEEYFMARYYAKSSNIDIEALKNVLTTGSVDFLKMYAEFIINCQPYIINNIIENTKPLHANIEKLVNFAQGTSFVFYNTNKSENASVDEILRRFPLSRIKYAAMDFDIEILDKIKNDGILEIAGIGYLEGCDVSLITDSPILVVRFVKSHDVHIEALYAEFLLFDSELHTLGGFTSHPQKPDIKFIKRFMLINDLEDYDIKVILQDEKLKIELYEAWQLEKGIRSLIEDSEMKRVFSILIDFMGRTQKYCCDYDNVNFTVYRICKSNVENIRQCFIKRHETRKTENINFYGCYKALMKSLTMSELSREDYDSLSFDISEECDFDTNSDLSLFLNSYYSAWWKNNDFWENKKKHYDEDRELITCFYKIEMNRLFDDMRKYNEMSLTVLIIISEEEMKTALIIGDYKNLYQVANKSLKLCKEADDSYGTSIRENILSLFSYKRIPTDEHGIAYDSEENNESNSFSVDNSIAFELDKLLSGMICKVWI